MLTDRGNASIRHGASHFAAALAALCLIFAVFATSAPAAVTGEVTGRRTALVIGNSQYRNFPGLPNAVNDAVRVKDVLEKANFEVVFGQDLDGKGIEETIRNFLRGMGDDDVALFYYSGHAIQVAGQNYILPVDASLATPYDLEVQAYNFSNFLSYMGASSALQIAILDACRDNPFKTGFYYVGDKKVDVTGNQGLAPTVPGLGTLIVYSTAPDQVAYDGAGELSPFSSAFAERALTPGVEVRELLTRIRNDVIQATSGRQIPWDVSSLTTSFYFIDNQDLLVVANETEVRLPRADEAAPLNLPVPIASGAEALTVGFTTLPAHGELQLAGAPFDPATPIKAERLAELTYRPDMAAPAAADEFGFEVRTASGKIAASSVKIVLEEQAPEPDQVEAPAVAAAEQAPEEEPQQVAMAADIGTGFVQVARDWGGERAVGDEWLRLSSRDAGAQVALGERVLGEGDLVRASELPGLVIRPSITSAGETLEVAFLPAARPSTPARKPARPLAITVSASVNECDRLAGEPLDIQGVVDGLLPNDIDIPAALAACERAVAGFPDVGRFKFEYARALYADGRFDDAADMLKKAYDQGHVRAGHLLGRFHQLGLVGERDPAKAIPYFEAGAEKGDPYAQHSLALALIRGNGTERNVERGMTLAVSAAEAGHTYSMNLLGFEYRSGSNVEQDPARALSFFQESTGREDVWGMANLGMLYRDGVGVGQDPARAMDLFIRADKGGQPEAARFIGVMLRDSGQGEPEDIADWFRKSAERGDAWGALLAAEMVQSDMSLAARPGEAERLYALAASRNTAEASDRAREALRAIEDRAIAVEVQQTLARMGQDVGTVDGVLGPRTRQAATAVLGAEPPGDPRELLVALVGAEWISSQPRLDML